MYSKMPTKRKISIFFALDGQVLSLSLSLCIYFFSMTIKGGKNRHLLSYSRENGNYINIDFGTDF